MFLADFYGQRTDCRETVKQRLCYAACNVFEQGRADLHLLLDYFSDLALSARPWEDPVKNGTVRGTFDPVGGEKDEFAV